MKFNQLSQKSEESLKTEANQQASYQELLKIKREQLMMTLSDASKAEHAYPVIIEPLSDITLEQAVSYVNPARYQNLPWTEKELILVGEFIHE